MSQYRRIIAFLIVTAGATAGTRAASPELREVTPRGAQRGTEADLVFHGDRLNDARDILFYQTGITIDKLDAKDPRTLNVHVHIAKDAPLGEYPLRVRTATGLSELRTFQVTAYPVVEEKEPNNDLEHAQPIPLNTTATGVITNEDVDYYAIDLKKGQRITAEVQGIRLGDAMFDPYVAIVDSKKFALAENDDTALARQDPIASAVAPADGKYYVMVRDTSYGGGGNYYYLLNVGTFPRPTTVFPLGGKAGEELNVRFIGDVSGPIVKTLKLPSEPTESLPVYVDQDGLVAPTPNVLRVAPFPNVLEQDGDNDIAHATPANQDPPVALNGIISKPGETDYFRFKAHKGKPLKIQVLARKLRSPLDSVITLHTIKGNQIAANDDSGGPDSMLRFNPPEDGEYVIGIYDQLRHGGPDYTYRIEITPVEPELTLQIPQFAQNSQERNWVVVPRGNRFATVIRATRENFGGDLKLSCPDLPPGVTMHCDVMPGNTDVVPVVFEAAPDAPVGAKLCTPTAESADGKVNIQGRYVQPVELVVGQGNSAMYKVHLPKLAVVVADEAPFKLRVVQPKVPIVQNGQMNLKVVAERSKDFKGPIGVRMMFNPPGIGSAASIEMPADKSEIDYPLSANDNAQARKWKICVLGSANINGATWASSDLQDLEVAEPFMDMKIEMSAVEQGKTCSVLCHIDPRTKFDGQATVKLLGLPPNTTASDMQITAADKQVVFNVVTTDKTPVGQHGSLFCQVTVTRDGEPIVHNLARGGVLRVDAPPAPKKGETAKPKAAAAPPPPASGKPLSRLEKLRLEAESKK